MDLVLRRAHLWWLALGVAATIAICCVGLNLLSPDEEPVSAPRSTPGTTAPGSPTPTAAAAPTGAATPTGAAMPNVAGQRLSDAEALLSSLGFRSVRATDGTGQGRTVLEKNNWIVQSQDPAAGTPAGPGSAVTLTVAKPTDGNGTRTATKGTIPDVLCKDLQSAQDVLRAAGFLNLTSADGTGQGRQQVLDRNWVVIGQSPAAGGTPPASQRIELTVVKFGEPTGASGCKS